MRSSVVNRSATGVSPKVKTGYTRISVGILVFPVGPRAGVAVTPDVFLESPGQTGRQGVISLVDKTFALRSHSVVGSHLYIATEVGTSGQEVMDLLDAKSLPFTLVQEVHALDERMLAFL